MEKGARFGLFALVVFLATTREAFGLQCWNCMSDTHPACNDRFNASDFYGGGARYYDNYNQNRQFPQQRPYDSNYNPNYPSDQNYNNPNYNSNYNPNYNPNFNQNSRSFLPTLETCNENDARLRRMRNVCMKQVLRGNNHLKVVRHCQMIPLEAYAGTCYQEPSTRGLSVDFCEYCEYDGCNSANGIVTNLFLAVSLAGAIFCIV